MKKIWLFLIIGGLFVLSLTFSQKVFLGYTGDVSKLLGLGALVMGYFVNRLIKNRATTLG